MQADSDGAQDFEAPHSAKPSSPVEAGFSSLPKQGGLPLPEEPVLAFPEVAVLQGITNIPQNLLPPSFSF